MKAVLALSASIVLSMMSACSQCGIGAKAPTKAEYIEKMDKKCKEIEEKSIAQMKEALAQADQEKAIAVFKKNLADVKSWNKELASFPRPKEDAELLSQIFKNWADSEAHAQNILLIVEKAGALMDSNPEAWAKQAGELVELQTKTMEIMKKNKELSAQFGFKVCGNEEIPSDDLPEPPSDEGENLEDEAEQDEGAEDPNGE